MNNDLKKLSRRELVDVIYQMKKNEDELLEQISALEASLEEKRIRLSSAGSIAEAAVDITNVFSAAQSTADLYLREIQVMKENAEKEFPSRYEEFSFGEVWFDYYEAKKFSIPKKIIEKKDE